MKKTVIYIHGKGGNANEAEHYKPLFSDCDVIGFDYKSAEPWEAKEEFPEYFDKMFSLYDEVGIIANSQGAYFSMHTLYEYPLSEAFFISPIADMEKLIKNMMKWAGVTEEELKIKKVIPTSFGEPLSWEYLSYVRANPVKWNIPTHILYGENDNLTSKETITEFAGNINADLTLMPGGEHWFHTEEQMNFIDKWINTILKNNK